MFPDSSPAFEAYCYGPKAAEEIHCQRTPRSSLERKASCAPVAVSTCSASRRNSYTERKRERERERERGERVKGREKKERKGKEKGKGRERSNAE